MTDTDWPEVFSGASEILNRSVYHGAPTVDGGECLWSAATTAYYDITGEDLDEDQADHDIAVRVLNEAVGVESLAAVFAWNDRHGDAEVRAAIGRAVELSAGVE